MDATECSKFFKTCWRLKKGKQIGERTEGRKRRMEERRKEGGRKRTKERVRGKGRRKKGRKKERGAEGRRNSSDFAPAIYHTKSPNTIRHPGLWAASKAQLIDSD